MIFNIATRSSELAQYQADTVMKLLKERVGVDSKKLLIETLGDKRQDVPISEIGGCNVFVDDVKAALMDGRADIAVHSLKDVSTDKCDKCELIAIPLRGDARDAFVSANGVSFYDLKEGATIGTSSARRRAQIKELRPDINVVSVRGDIKTRVKKIKTENLDGILIAAVGLERLGIDNLITDYFDAEKFIPSAGQGALAVEIHKDNKYKDILKKLDCEKTRALVEAERSFEKYFDDPHAPAGAYARLDGEEIYMVGMYELDGKIIRKDIRGKIEESIDLGEKLARKILED